MISFQLANFIEAWRNSEAYQQFKAQKLEHYAKIKEIFPQILDSELWEAEKLFTELKPCATCKSFDECPKRYGKGIDVYYIACSKDGYIRGMYTLCKQHPQTYEPVIDETEFGPNETYWQPKRWQP